MILGSHSQEKNLWARAAATRQEKTALSFAILWLAAAADQIQVRQPGGSVKATDE
jgi:hypothetical protein